MDLDPDCQGLIQAVLLGVYVTFGKLLNFSASISLFIKYDYNSNYFMEFLRVLNELIPIKHLIP